MAIRDTSREAVALMSRAILDLPEVERIEFVAGKRGPFLRVHLQSAQPTRAGRMLKDSPAFSIRRIAGYLRTQLDSRCPVSIVEHGRSARHA